MDISLKRRIVTQVLEAGSISRTRAENLVDTIAAMIRGAAPAAQPVPAASVVRQAPVKAGNLSQVITNLRSMRPEDGDQQSFDVPTAQKYIDEACAALAAAPAQPVPDAQPTAVDAGGLSWALKQISDLDPEISSIGTAVFMAREALAAVAQSERKPFHHYGLSAEEVAQLLNGGLKPEEIGGPDDTQHGRVGELVRWFARFTRGNANPKWAAQHACELAYFISTNGINRNIDLAAVRRAAFKEGVNITDEERGSMERIGVATPRATPATPPPAPRLTDAEICEIHDSMYPAVVFDRERVMGNVVKFVRAIECRLKGGTA